MTIEHKNDTPLKSDETLIWELPYKYRITADGTGQYILSCNGYFVYSSDDENKAIKIYGNLIGNGQRYISELEDRRAA